MVTREVFPWIVANARVPKPRNVGLFGNPGLIWKQAIIVTLVARASLIAVPTTLIEPFQPNVWPGGRAVAITVSPNNSAVAIAASESGGLFQTRDGGTTWTHLDGLLPFRMADVKYSPVSSQSIVATAFADTRTSNRGGIWQSMDGGRTWQKAQTSNPRSGPKCPISANAFGISYVPAGIFVGTDCGVAISRDDGVTWNYVAPDPSASSWRIFSVVAHGAGIVDACGDMGVYRSLNNGATWGPVSTGAGGCRQTGTHLIDASPFDPNVIFFTPFPDSLFESDDGGGSWATLNPPSPNHDGRPSWVKVSAAVSGTPNQFDLFFGNPYNVVRQRCGSGTRLNCSGSWTSVTVGPGEESHEPNACAFDASGTVPEFITTDSGIYRTVDGGSTFTVVGGGAKGFDALQVYEVAGQVHPDHSDLFIGTQDNCLWASPNDGRTWIHPRCPEGFALQMKRKTPSHNGEIITGVDVDWGNFKSSDHFRIFDHWNDPPNNVGNPFIIDTGTYIQYVRAPGSPNTMIALTTNTGSTWNLIMESSDSNPLTIVESLSYWPQIVGPPDHPRIYQAIERPGGSAAGSNIGLLRIDIDVANRTATMAPADVTGLGSLGAYGLGQGSWVIATVFGADPHDTQHLIAPDVVSGLMKVTRNGGNTWSAMQQLTGLILNGGEFLFNVPSVSLQVHAVAFDPDQRGHILIGTEAAGVFESKDDGGTWAKIPFSDFFIRGISNFFFDRDSTVIVATYGHGLWKLVPGDLSPPVLCQSSPGRCLVDVRTVNGDRIYPRWICPHPPELPTCQVFGLTKGVVEDIALSSDGTLSRLALSGRGLAAYDMYGKRTHSSLPVKPVIAAHPGEFSGCPAGIDILREGGTITGFIMEQQRLVAIVSEFPRKVLEPRNYLAEKKEKRPRPRALPYLQLVGTRQITGQTIAATGDTIEIYGSGFCGSPGCSPVKIKIGDRVVAKSVLVDRKGSFKTKVKVTEIAGRYLVSAFQTSEKGEELRDERMLVVPVIDREEK